MLGSKVSLLAFLDISFSLRVELETFSALSFQSLVLNSSGSPTVRVLHLGSTLYGDVGS